MLSVTNGNWAHLSELRSQVLGFVYKSFQQFKYFLLEKNKKENRS